MTAVTLARLKWSHVYMAAGALLFVAVGIQRGWSDEGTILDAILGVSWVWGLGFLLHMERSREIRERYGRLMRDSDARHEAEIAALQRDAAR